jgi:hypothetical protein
VGRSLLRLLRPLALPAVAIAAAGFLIYRERVSAERDWQAQEAARRAREATRESLLAGDALGPVLALCRDGWRDQLSLYHEPAALAWTRQGLDAYFLEGTDRTSLRQVRCDARGVARGPRVPVLLQPPVPAEAPPGRAEAPPLPAEAPPGSPHDAGEEKGYTHLDLATLSSYRLAPRDVAVEFVAHPVSGALLTRRWRAAEAGSETRSEPADAPAFPLLVASPGFRSEGTAPPRLQPLPRRYWLAEADAAFALIERALPKGARIAEITLSDDKIEVSIDAPTPAFDGKPPVPYGDKTFDEYGGAETEWWYPREIPGFGCPRGQPLASVRAAFANARSRLAGQSLASAWYSCSPAYTNGRDGAWHLVAQ